MAKSPSRHDDTGASAVEYGLLIAGIAAVIVFAVFILGNMTDSMFEETCGQIDSAAQSTANC